MLEEGQLVFNLVCLDQQIRIARTLTPTQQPRPHPSSHQVVWLPTLQSTRTPKLKWLTPLYQAHTLSSSEDQHLEMHTPTLSRSRSRSTAGFSPQQSLRPLSLQKQVATLSTRCLSLHPRTILQALVTQMLTARSAPTQSNLLMEVS